MSDPVVGPPDVTTMSPSAPPAAAPPLTPNDPITDQSGMSMEGVNTPDVTPGPATPQKPSLWRGVLAGALSGLAAGASVNTRGMSAGNAFAAGAGAGVNDVLNVQPQRKAELDNAKLSTALHYATLAKMQRDFANEPPDIKTARLNQLADHSEDLEKSGAIVPIGEPSDYNTAQKGLQAAHAKDPWNVYGIAPRTGPKGDIQYAVVESPKGPLQKDLVLTDDKTGQTIFKAPAGTPADTAYKAYTVAYEKYSDQQNKLRIAQQNMAGRKEIQAGKNTTALDVQGLKNQGAAAKAANAASLKAPDMAWGTQMVDGVPTQVAGPPQELTAAGVQGVTKLPGTEAQKVVVARQLIGPRKGLFDMVNNDIDTLAKAGKLGVAASRWGEFMAGTVGSEPEFQPLRTHMGLLSTALMQAHVGARGSKEMLQHFKDLANYSISDEATLRKALAAEWQYVNEKAMLPKGNPAAGRTGPGQAPPAPAPTAGAGAGPAQSFAAWKNNQPQKGQ